MKQKFRKPLVIMTPKSLLRKKTCVSTLDELATGGFSMVLADTAHIKKARRILVCSGKVYYNLLEHRNELKNSDIAIVRVEQLYPFPEREISAIIDTHPPNARDILVSRGVGKSRRMAIHSLSPRCPARIFTAALHLRITPRQPQPGDRLLQATFRRIGLDPPARL